MKIKALVATVGLLSLLAACGDGDGTSGSMGSGAQDTTTSGTVPAGEVDKDPTPQTGTGGPSQSTTDGQTSQ
jgi:major membrane immunogen (membrane-anchored lipoprotein)